MPAKLDAVSSVTQELINWAMLALPSLGQFRAWAPWMDVMQVNPHYLGQSGQGCFVLWRQQRYSSLAALQRAALQNTVRAAIKQCFEDVLVSLSRRIARVVVEGIILHYAMPQQITNQGRPLLTRQQYGRAAKEILGETWYDLLFDHGNILRNWSEEDVFGPYPRARLGGNAEGGRS